MLYAEGDVDVVSRINSESVSELVDGVIEDQGPSIIEDAVGLDEVVVEKMGSDDIEGVDGVADLVECVIEDRGPEGVKGGQPQNCTASGAPELVTAGVGSVILSNYAARHLNGLAVFRLDMSGEVGGSRVGLTFAAGLLAT
ncbi:hypothetical protein CMEL01_10870 [Colletotrichum melonis]|uniref:Uncharacterized protein n=1 Tax=Colletotrichum melonis TaxID=1209925 RepID=A0AAI9Y142_9PEZI|nr:hypothetical protein CMEL01_10870 [Colletotrichum melonis]